MLVVAIGRLGKGLQARSDYRQVAGVLVGGCPEPTPRSREVLRDWHLPIQLEWERQTKVGSEQIFISK